MRLAPWHVKGIAPGARETARAAARRSGQSVGQWLNSMILDRAAAEGVPPAHGDSPAPSENLATINLRLDELGRQLDRLAQRPAAPQGEEPSRRIADAILQLNGRLDQVIAEGRNASSVLERRVSNVD